MLYVGSDTTLVVKGVKDGITKLVIFDATVIGRVLNEAGTAVADDIPFAYATDSQGDYLGVISHSVPLEAGKTYTVELVITTPSPKESVLTLRFQAPALYKKPTIVRV